jgi:hypothetical protein
MAPDQRELTIVSRYAARAVSHDCPVTGHASPSWLRPRHRGGAGRRVLKASAGAAAPVCTAPESGQLIVTGSAAAEKARRRVAEQVLGERRCCPRNGRTSAFSIRRSRIRSTFQDCLLRECSRSSFERGAEHVASGCYRSWKLQGERDWEPAEAPASSRVRIKALTRGRRETAAEQATYPPLVVVMFSECAARQRQEG